jgi:UDP-2-acetamido-3-amino-2,3-dideoxy-glucuronate N-acetyltransferase
MAKAALEAGKDVMVEKPLAIDVTHGETVASLAKANGRILMVGHILRYHPAFLKLQQLVAGGALGKIDYLYSNRLNIGKIRTEENILWSFAPHDISVMLALLNEMPTRVSCQGGAYLNSDVYDVTLSHFDFPSGVRRTSSSAGCIRSRSSGWSSWDPNRWRSSTTRASTSCLYPHRVEWKNRIPTAVKAAGEIVRLDDREPLREECRHFLDCVKSRTSPTSDGAEGLRCCACWTPVSVRCRTARCCCRRPPPRQTKREATAAVSSFTSPRTSTMGPRWERNQGLALLARHESARIGKRCVIGQNVNIDGGTTIGSNVRFRTTCRSTGHRHRGRRVSGTVVRADQREQSAVAGQPAYACETTWLKRGCTIGANATIVCGVMIGRYAFVGAGSVVTKTCGLRAGRGNSARQIGWMSRHGHRLESPDIEGVMRCPESGYRYKETERRASMPRPG